MAPVGLEPTIPTSRRRQTDASDRAGTSFENICCEIRLERNQDTETTWRGKAGKSWGTKSVGIV